MTKEELANLSLSMVGISNNISDLDTDNSREAATVRVWYDVTLRAFLELYPWATTRKYARLALVRGPAWSTDSAILDNVQAWSSSATYAVGDIVRRSSINYYAILASTNQQPPNATYWVTVLAATTAQTPLNANGDALYGYRYPTDCLNARRLVPFTGEGRKFLEEPPTYFTGQDANGRVIFTDQAGYLTTLGSTSVCYNPELEYTSLDCTHLWVSSLMIKGWATFLASAVAPELSRNKVTAAELLQLSAWYMRKAQALDVREQQQEPNGDPDWIAHR